MVDYEIAYDLSALVIMLMFSAYYFTRKRYKNMQNRMFNHLVLFVILSISFDLISVFVLAKRAVMPVFVLYVSNILYFFFTGIMSVIFCVYSMRQTRSDSMIRQNRLIRAIFFTPCVGFVASLLSTPWTKLVFYIDEEHNYGHGPLMDTMLIIVVLYLAFSFFCMTVYNDEVSLRKRFPYYLFMVFMTIAILIQWLTAVYLMYGFAEAVGVVIIYLSNHNPTDMVDSTTELYNRRALLNRLEQINNDSGHAVVIGIGEADILDLIADKGIDEVDAILAKIGRFIRESFKEENAFYLGEGGYAIVLEQDSDPAAAEQIIRDRFAEPWATLNSSYDFTVGLGELLFPDDVVHPGQLIERLEYCIALSTEASGKVIRISDISTDAQRKIRKLERRQRKLEEQYIETEGMMQKAVSADRSKSLFLAQMSHEIRTPMTAILGMTELVLRDSDNEKVKQHASAIMSSGKSLIGIINDILDFSKIEAGKLELINEEYYISSTVNDIISSIEQRVSDKRLDLSVDFDGTIPAVLLGDEIRVKQIIINLMTNACKYTEHGSITFKIGWERRGDICDLLISVKDTGIGIKEEYISKLFIGFERFDGVRNKAIEGTGLGLAICKQLIDTMEGTIDVHSVYGEGSEFVVRLPQRIVDDTPSVHVAEPKSIRVLAYCGDKNEHRDYERVFSQFGIEREFVSCSEELDERLTDDRFTHIFIPLSEFQKRMTAHDKLISDPRVIIALYYRQYSANVSGHRTLNMPIFSINVASLLGGDTVLDSGPSATSVRNYTAPEAIILVVDDNVVNLQIFTGLLECHHFTIDTADSGYKCLKMAREKKYDMIFLDHMMPRKDGIETLHDMEADELSLNRDTPVVAFTANAISGMKEKFAEEGFSDFLSKPIDIAKMEDILVRYLPQEKVIYFDPAVMAQEKKEEFATATEPDYSSFTVQGLDMSKALFYAGGDPKALIKILEVMLKDGTTKQGLQKELVESGQFDDYRIEIHAVKSLCKGIGADELSEKARLLEMACKESDTDYVKANYLEAYEEYMELLDNIDTALRSVRAVKQPKQATQEESRLDPYEYLTCIHALLKEFEEELATKMVDVLSDRQLDDELADKIQQIKDLLDVYDYENSARIIEEVLDNR